MGEFGFVLLIIAIGILLLNPGLLVFLAFIGLIVVLVLYFQKLEEKNVDEMNVNSYECREALKKASEIQKLFEQATKKYGGHSFVSLYDKKYDELTDSDYETSKYQLCVYLHLNVDNYSIVKFYKNQYKYGEQSSALVAQKYVEDLFSTPYKETEKLLSPVDVLFDTELIEPDESYYIYRLFVPSALQGNKRKVFIEELEKYRE